jgi:hypothetical protein
MRWYLNEASIQGQFASLEELGEVLGGLLAVRMRVQPLQQGLRVGRAIGERPAVRGELFREIALRLPDRLLRSALLNWIDRTGPFTDDERLAEAEDYFECMGVDVTDQGLGEAARRLKVGDDSCSFSFEGGPIDFAFSPLEVRQGLPEDVLARFDVRNFWLTRDLEAHGASQIAAAQSWQELVEQARGRFPKLEIPDLVFQNRLLAREPFDAVIRERALALMGHLQAYMGSLGLDGSETDRSREITAQYFSGERALFSPESQTNQRDFKEEMTFQNPTKPDQTIFGHWHGKISHKFYRMHIEWPVPAGEKAKVLYLGPKLTKS